MGIKNLKYLINRYAKDAVNEKFLISYDSKVIAIDVSIYLYRFIYANGEPLELLTKQIMRLLKNGIIPLYVFDGKPPKEKFEVLDERAKQKNELLSRQLQIKTLLENSNVSEQDEIETEPGVIVENAIELGDLTKMSVEDLRQELSKIEKRIIIVNGEVIANCKKLFELMGIPYIVANGEAESLCAKLIKEGLVYGCLSEDTDILANGGRYFIRNFNVNNNKVIEYDLDKILSNFGVSYEQFIDICILCGCDYTGTIKNIGVEKAYKFVKQCKSVEGVIKYVNIENSKNLSKNKEARYIIPDNFNYEKARELFLTCGADEDYNELKKKILLKRPKMDELLDYIEHDTKAVVFNDVRKNLLKFHTTIEKKNELTMNNFYKAV
jgi:flap endonuclease-1